MKMQLTTREEDPSLNQLRTGLLQVPAPVLHDGQQQLLPAGLLQSPLQLKVPLTGGQQQLLQKKAVIPKNLKQANHRAENKK